MTISLGGRQFLPVGMSERERLVVACIDGGRQWLDWASSNPTHHYHFDDMADMVTAVQTGLHGTSTAYLREAGLLISPLKLMTMSSEDLRTLAKGGSGSWPQLAGVLEYHHLASQADFEQVSSFVKALGADDAPIFGARSLADLSLLLSLRREVDVAAPLTAEAVKLALANAASIPEFADYLRFYGDCARALDLGASTPRSRLAAVDNAVRELLSLTFPALDGPELPGSLPPRQVIAAVRDWLSTGRQLGFARASLAMQQFVADGRYAGQTGHGAAELFHAFLGHAQHVLSTGESGAARVAQDGLAYSFELTADDDRVEVEVTAAGRVTIARFGRITQSKPKTDRTGSPPTPKQRARRGVSAKVSGD